MDIMSLGLVLAVMLVFAIITVVGGILLLFMRKPGSTASSSELTYLRQEVARLHKEVERLREDVAQIKSGPTAAGSTDIQSK